jgi:hypothetical protein
VFFAFVFLFDLNNRCSPITTTNGNNVSIDCSTREMDDTGARHYVVIDNEKEYVCHTVIYSLKKRSDNNKQKIM